MGAFATAPEFDRSWVQILASVVLVIFAKSNNDPVVFERVISIVRKFNGFSTQIFDLFSQKVFADFFPRFVSPVILSGRDII